MQNINEIGQSAAELWPKKNRFSILRTSAILSLQIFIFGRVAVVSFIICYHHQSELVGDVAVPMSAAKLLTCVKFHQNRMIFREDIAF